MGQAISDCCAPQPLSQTPSDISRAIEHGFRPQVAQNTQRFYEDLSGTAPELQEQTVVVLSTSEVAAALRIAESETGRKGTLDVSAAVHVTSIGDASLPNPVEQRKDDSSSTRVIEDGGLSMLASLNSAFRHTGSAPTPDPTPVRSDNGPAAESAARVLGQPLSSMDYGDKWREQPIFDTLGSIVARPAVESSDTGGLEDVMWSLNSTFRHTSAARMQQLGAGDGSAEAFDPRPDPLGLGSGDAPLTLFRHNSFPAQTEQLGNTRQVNMADLTTSADRVRHEEDAGAGSVARDGPTPPTTAKQPPTQNLQDGPVSTTVSSPLSRRPLRAPADGHMPPKRKSPAEIADSVRLGVRSASAFDEAAAAETLTLEEEISRWEKNCILLDRLKASSQGDLNLRGNSADLGDAALSARPRVQCA